MFLWRNDGDLWITLQTDHMTQTGEIARLWGHRGFSPPRRTGAVTAARLHDEGWALVDVDPEFDENTGLPVELTGKVFGSVFGSTTMPASHYRRGVDLLLGIDKYAALIASLHGTGVYLRDYGIDGAEIPNRSQMEPHVRQFVEQEEQFQTRLREETGATDEEVWHDFRLFIAWNRLSQIFSRGLASGWLSQVPTTAAPDGIRINARRIDTLTVALDPYPFEDEPELAPVKTYRIPDRLYESVRDFIGTIGETPPFSAVYRAVAER
jgi:hypothetical protein